MSKLRLTVACGDYDIVRALKEGTVEAGGLELIFLTDMGPRERHWRLARKMEFDVCEENVGAYFMARDRGDPVTALPVFLHRRFRHGFVFINSSAGIKSPKDLIGRQVGGTNFQPAGNIWMRGILEEHYGVPHREITWIVDRSEDVPFTPPPGVRTAVEEQEDILGRDPWTYGLTPINRKTLETIQRYTHQQGMVGKVRPLGELFEDTDLGDSGGSEEV